jgi:hypothetical protein
MKSHEIAALFRHLAEAIRDNPMMADMPTEYTNQDHVYALHRAASMLLDAPNSDLDDLRVSRLTSRTRRTPGSIPIGLGALLALSQIDKSEWVEFIEDSRLPIEVRDRDASRDIVFKVAKYLEDNQDARKSMMRTVRKSNQEASPELVRALKAILR